MNLKELIEFGKTITTNDVSYYRWLIDVREYLEALPNSRYLNLASAPLNEADAVGENKIVRCKSVAKIVAILTKIYDDESEKFLQDNIRNPLLSIFKNPKLIEVQKEFEQAIVFLNEGRYKHAIIEIYKAEESLMKEICKKTGTTYQNNDAFGNLVNKLQDAQIIPVSGMISGYPVVRNKAAAHGAEPETYTPKKEDAEFEINRGAVLLLYLYQKAEWEMI